MVSHSFFCTNNFQFSSEAIYYFDDVHTKNEMMTIMMLVDESFIVCMGLNEMNVKSFSLFLDCFV